MGSAARRSGAYRGGTGRLGRRTSRAQTHASPANGTLGGRIFLGALLTTPALAAPGDAFLGLLTQLDGTA
jgi:hypothetical protein